jgi:hypothetical protein
MKLIKYLTGLVAFSPIVLFLAGLKYMDHLKEVGKLNALLESSNFEIYVYSLIIYCWLVVILFIVINWRSTLVSTQNKKSWTTFLIILNMFATPIFWYSRVWKSH